MKTTVSFKDLKLHKPHRVIRKSRSTVVGFDTESMVNGYAFLVTDSCGNYKWIRSAEGVLAFLTNPAYKDSFNTFWYMDFDVMVMMKWLGYEFCKELVTSRKAVYQGVRFEYVPKRFFVVRSGNTWNTFYDACQYYSPRSLDGASKIYLGKAKGNPGTKEFTEADYGSEKILEYCKLDSELCSKLTVLLLKDLDSMGLVADTLASPGTIMENALVGVVDLPDVTKIPSGAMEYAFEAYNGGWMECFRRGYFPKLWDYDISSAYPYQVSELPSLLEGGFVYSKNRPKGALFGFEKGKVSITSRISPVIYQGDVNFTPLGGWNRKLYTGLVDFVRQRKLGSFDAVDGWYFVSERAPSRPFRFEMRRLFRLRSKVRNKWLAKSLGVSLYGKFAQVLEDGTGGNLCNFVYASMITDRTRLQVADYALMLPDDLCVVATDGLAFSAPLSSSVLSKSFGGLKLAHCDEGVVVGTNVYTIKGKAPVGDWRPGRFNWLKLLRENPTLDTFKLEQFRCTTLPEGVSSEERFEKVGVFETFPYDFHLNFDRKRFSPQVSCARDLMENVYESYPWEVSMPRKRQEVLWDVE